jgi:molybdate transport system permease protein
MIIMANFDISPLYISLKTAFIATIITFFVGITAAWLMEKYNGKLKGFIDGVLTLPLVLPPTVVGFFLLVLFGKFGPLGKLLSYAGVSIIFTWWAGVLASVVVAFPIMYKTSRGAFEQIDNNIINAARTLGVSELKIFFKITLPLAWPGIIAAAILTFARAIGEFGATMMVAGNIPGRTQTMPLAIFFAAESGEMDKALIWVMLIMGISLFVIVLMNMWNDYQKRFLCRGVK